MISFNVPPFTGKEFDYMNPGYVGYEEGGQLTEKVRRKPYSIVLLDEIEKAHPDVFNILLQVLDDGQLTDSLGRKVDFKNTIIIMTSNIGSRQLKDFGQGVGFGTQAKRDNANEYSHSVIENALKRTFAPEFLNRVDDVVMFNSLKREDIHKIIDIELRNIFKRVEEMGYTLELTTQAKDFIADGEGQSIVNRLALSGMFTNVLCRPNFISYELKSSGQLTFAAMKKLSNLDCFAWTLKSQAELDEAHAQGFKGYIFDSFEAHMPN